MVLNYDVLKSLSVVGLLLSMSLPLSVQAETCSPLNLIGGTGTKVKKTVSPFSTLVTNNNWNTDFAVPSDRSFNRYLATIMPENNANYDIELNLKYSDNSSSSGYKKDNVAVMAGRVLELSATSRPQRNPFQVNIFVGGLNAIGNTYTVSVAACA